MWNFYFLLKLYLFYKGSIKLNIVLNLLFLIFVMLPVPARISKYRTFRFCRGVLNIVLAFLLLWYDSWLPPIIDASIFLHQQGMPSFGYLISFIRGWFDMSIILVIVLLLSVGFMVRKYKIVTTAVLTILIIAFPLIPAGYFGLSQKEEAKVQVQPAKASEIDDPAKYLDSFYSTESERVIMFKQPDTAQPPFDIVVLHICSLSINDLKEIGMTIDDPFFKQFDYLFTNFNTATGYSGPAVLRLLQANCGQRSHKDIHNGKKDIPKMCLLFESLTSIGYEAYISIDHDGKYGDFLNTIKRFAPDNSIMIEPGNLSPEAMFFDEKSPLYNDFTLFKKWFDIRQASKSERAVFFYNTALLHAGSHWVGEKKWFLRDKHEQYKEVSSALLKDIKKFIELLKSSNRNTVLIFVPEHGRALTGSPFQPPDIRDIPLPKITIVPVGIKLIGPKFSNTKAGQQIISKPTSYLAISWLLSKFIEKSPFGDNPLSPEDIVFKIPKTDFVSEHEGRVIIEMGGKYLFYGKDKKWVPLTPEQLK